MVFTRLVTLATVILPSVPRELVQVYWTLFAESIAGKFVEAKKPLTPVLNSWNESPACNAGPRFVTVKVPPAVIVPLMVTIESFVAVALVRFNSISTAPASVRLLATVNAPMVSPGLMVEPALATTFPFTVPLPFNV